MKTLILILASITLAVMASAQRIAHNPHYKTKPVEPMAVPAFITYVSEIEKQITYNDFKMADLNYFVQNLQPLLSSKTISKVKQLNVEMNELKNDLNNFKKYGKGDWKIFQKEFNSDLKSVSDDLDVLHAILFREYQVIA